MLPTWHLDTVQIIAYTDTMLNQNISRRAIGVSLNALVFISCMYHFNIAVHSYLVCMYVCIRQQMLFDTALLSVTTVYQTLPMYSSSKAVPHSCVCVPGAYYHHLATWYLVGIVHI